MFKKVLSNLLALLATPFLVPNSVIAETIVPLIEARTLYPRTCHIIIDSWEGDCQSVTIGFLSDYSAFNIKLCSSNNRCLILIGDTNELIYYRSSMRIYSVAWQEGKKITKRWSSNLIFGPYLYGHGIAGTLEGSIIAAYFED
ncbi:MAG: hypothetical protein VKL42_09340 [Snowella sp.]|nr:hypothetical protein [Snowella sp.]